MVDDHYPVFKWLFFGNIPNMGTNILPWNDPPCYSWENYQLFRLGHVQLQSVSSPEGKYGCV